MEAYYNLLIEWIISLGEKHEVDPLILGSLYLVSKVCFFSCLIWLLRTLKAKKPLLIPILFSAVSFSLPYLYLIIAGRNISIWVYVFIALMFAYGGYTIWKKITVKPVEESL